MRVAIELVLVPSRVRLLKAEPLPECVPFLLRIVTGDEDAARGVAWNNLKTPERRAIYAMARNARETEHRTRRAGRSNGSSAVPCHLNETGYSWVANSGTMREPSQAIGVH